MKLVIIGDVHLSESTPRSWCADYAKVTLDDFIKAVELGDVALVLGDNVGYDVDYIPCG